MGHITLVERLLARCLGYNEKPMDDDAESMHVSCGLLREASTRITELEAQLAVAHDGLTVAYLAGAESVRGELDALKLDIADRL